MLFHYFQICFQANELSAPDQRKIKEWKRHCDYYSSKLSKVHKKKVGEPKEITKEEQPTENKAEIAASVEETKTEEKV